MSGTESPGHAEDLFADFLLALQNGERVEFEDLCRANSEVADELRGLYDNQELISAILNADRAADSFDRKLQLLVDAPDASASTDERYRVEGVIGRGGMGRILKVWDSNLRRYLAMKVSLGSESGGDFESPLALARFLDEAQTTSRLVHPGIVPVHELGRSENGTTYFTMQLVEGRTLTEIFELASSQEEGWSQARVMTVMLRVCEAVAYAHSQGVVHRDLKPANIMVGQFGEVYVMDWGLAKVKERENPQGFDGGDPFDKSSTPRFETLAGTVVGTPAYMAPEQARGDLENVGPSADVYALGAMLYQLLTGRVPFQGSGDGSDPREVIQRVIAGRRPSIQALNPAVSPELASVCDKAMAKDPKDRYSDMIEMADDLRAFTENRVVKAHRNGVRIEVQKWMIRNRALSVALIGLFVFAVVVWITTTVVQVRSRDRLEQQVNLAKNETLRANHQFRAARRNAEIAESQTEKAQRRLEDYVRMADVRRVAEIEVDARSLWPRRKEKIWEMEDWLGKAQSLVRRLPRHRTTLDDLVRKGGLASAEDRWQRDVLTDLVERIIALSNPEIGLIDEVKERLFVARSIEEETVTKRQQEWVAALKAIGEDPAYRGLSFLPIPGLVPLEPDPDSGLWEFWIPESGDRPIREPCGTLERWRITGATGMVLVLLPEGTFQMGAEILPGDTTVMDDELPVHPVHLAPFFISKYEMTQGQWMRLMGDNPSEVQAGSPYIDPEEPFSHPLEQVSWVEASDAAWRLGLSLPTEAQWEYAARGGTETKWWTGNDPRRLLEGGNVADRSYRDAGGQSMTERWNDGYVAHAPVGTFAENPFGLFDVHGNVWELCRDWYSGTGYEGELVENTGEPLSTAPMAWLFAAHLPEYDFSSVWCCHFDFSTTVFFQNWTSFDRCFSSLQIGEEHIDVFNPDVDSPPFV